MITLSLREEEITRQLGAVFKNLKLPPEILEQTAETLRNLHKEKIEFHNKHFDELTQEHKKYTRMMDNLYMDKLQGSITTSAYDKFYQTLREKLDDINFKLGQLQEADENYFITSKYILDLTSRAYELFKSSEVDEKRQLIKLILQNLELDDDEKLVWQAHKPFDLILEMNDCQLWPCQLKPWRKLVPPS